MVALMPVITREKMKISIREIISPAITKIRDCLNSFGFFSFIIVCGSPFLIS